MANVEAKFQEPMSKTACSYLNQLIYM